MNDIHVTRWWILQRCVPVSLSFCLLLAVPYPSNTHSLCHSITLSVIASLCLSVCLSCFFLLLHLKKKFLLFLLVCFSLFLVFHSWTVQQKSGRLTMKLPVLSKTWTSPLAMPKRIFFPSGDHWNKPSQADSNYSTAIEDKMQLPAKQTTMCCCSKSSLMSTGRFQSSSTKMEKKQNTPAQ